VKLNNISAPFGSLALLLSCFADAAITHPHIKWAFQTDGPVRGSPVVSGNVLYAGSADGFIYAMDKSTGELIWKFDTHGAVDGAPAVTDDKVIVSGRGSRVYALDRAKGSVLWSFEMRATLPTATEWNFFTAPPVVDGKQVLVPSGDGFLYALDLSSGKLQWKFQTADSVRAAPLVANDTIYQPSGDDYVYALSRDGKLRWKFATDGLKYDLSQGFIRSDIFSRPSLKDRSLVFASRDGNVYAVDINSHRARWKFAYDTTWAMSSTINAGTVYVGWSINNKINAIDLQTGKQKWEFTAGAHTYTTALIDGDSSYWGCADGNVYNLNKDTGKMQWSYSVGSPIHSSLVNDNDTLYFGTDDGRVLAVSDSNGQADKAVYLPENIPQSLKPLVVDAALVPYLMQQGYERLSSATALERWIAAHTRADRSSAIVFGFALLPDSVLGSNPASGPLRRYLESGGKVVWSSGAPNRYKFGAAGNFVKLTPEIPNQLLGVDFLDFEDSGNYFARATQMGRNWGLRVSLTTSYAVLKNSSTDDVTPLAIDEYGRVTAFVKQFIPRAGTGWVSFTPNIFGAKMTQQELATVEHLASYKLQ